MRTRSPPPRLQACRASGQMAALVWLIDEKWQQALLALVLAWSLAGLALWLRGLRRA